MGDMVAQPKRNLVSTPERAKDLVGSRKPCVMILGSAPPSAPVATTTTIIITTTTTIIIMIMTMTMTMITITITKPMITFSVMTVLVKTTSSDGPHSRRPRHLSAWILAWKLEARRMAAESGSLRAITRKSRRNARRNTRAQKSSKSVWKHVVWSDWENAAFCSFRKERIDCE